MSYSEQKKIKAFLTINIDKLMVKTINALFI